MVLFEEQLNKKLKTGNLKVHVAPIPMPRDMLFPALESGKVDMVVAQLTVTPERQKVVDFTEPTRRNVSEVVVTGPGAAPVAAASDLSGREVFVRKTSSYFESLQALNRTLEGQGKPPVDVQLASESLEDDDLLEMVNAGLIPATVVDDYLADFWKQVFPDMTVHSAATLRTGGNLAVAMRKNSPSSPPSSMRTSRRTAWIPPSAASSTNATWRARGSSGTPRRRQSGRNSSRWPSCSGNTETSTSSTTY